MILKLALNGIIFLLTIASGVWLSKLGKPYSTLVFNLHKFIALGLIVYVFILVKNLIKTSNVSVVMWILISIAALSVITLLLSGGMLSHKEQISDLLVISHKISSSSLLISLIAWFYLYMR